MVIKDGKPILCVGAPGSRKIINRVAQVLINVLEFGMGIQNAIAMPTVDASTRITLVDSRMPSEVINKLRTIGHRVVKIDEEPGNSNFSRPSGIFYNINTGLFHGGVDVWTAAISHGY